MYNYTEKNIYFTTKIIKVGALQRMLCVVTKKSKTTKKSNKTNKIIKYFQNV